MEKPNYRLVLRTHNKRPVCIVFSRPLRLSASPSRSRRSGRADEVIE